jgi:adenosylcobyric acid synthase
VLLGRVWAQVTAADYHTRRVEQLFPVVMESYHKLAAQYDVILLEGAGSPAEINLREHDIVNMRMARAAGAACLLVGDIDRGGVFASLYGTLELLEPWERALVRGFAINKFRGDLGLLRPGVEMMEHRLGLPCAGVVPYLHNHGLDEEDGVALEDRRTPARYWDRSDAPGRKLRIGVIAFPHLANFTDFDALAAEPSVALAYLERPEEVEAADLLILPGSKQTLADLDWLHRTGFVAALSAYSGRVAGICGGFQMLGVRIDDPTGMENDGTALSCAGLGLLPVATVLREHKITRPVTGRAFGGVAFHGYEIHVGDTPTDAPFAQTEYGPDGAVSADGRVFGTYIHGLFDDDTFRHAFVDAMRAARGLAPAAGRAFTGAEREARIDRLADHLRQSLDMNLIRTWIRP